MFKKVLCLLLALACLGTLAFAESTEDLEARIAELEAEVALYKPYYDAQVIIEYDGGVVLKDDVLEQYDYYAEMYSSYYGIDLESYGLASSVKEQAATNLLQNAALDRKAAELGLDVLDETVLADLEAQANETWESYIQTIAEQMLEQNGTEDQTVEDFREDAISYLETNGYSLEELVENQKVNYIDELLYDYATADVTVTEEEIEAEYASEVESDKETYANSSSYIQARNNGTTVAWTPEGYRAVKQVLVKFDDDQSTRYDELTEELESLQEALEALENPTEETEETTEETTEEATEEVEVRTAEEIQADIATVQANLDALYEELMPTVNEVIDKFNNGESIESLIETYNEDPGMTSEPTASQGYAVTADNSYYDAAFTEAAMSIESVGGISEPAKGSYGIYIVYYMADIESGETGIDALHDTIQADLLSDKISATYSEALQSWVDALNPVYHLDLLSD